MVLLRGFLYVSLIEAENLPDTDRAFFNLYGKDTSDPFAQVKIGTNVICKTGHVDNNTNPVWNAHYRIPICHEVDFLTVMVLDKDYNDEDHIGGYEVRGVDLEKGTKLVGWYPLYGCKGKINLKMNYVSKKDIGATFEVPDCYFPMKENCSVRMYQDAHCPPLPMFENVTNLSGETYEPPCAWTDIYASLNSAKKFIYITGWSVYTETILVRGEGFGHDCKKGGETLGELLKRKSEEGVLVLILIWDEQASSLGKMGTHDADTRDYFEGTNITVAIVPRVKNLEGVAGFMQNHIAETCYSHHQKTIILDADPIDGKGLRRVVAFLGGLDLTDGRWDTPEHELFKTLRTKHCEDFYNGCVDTTKEFGPRQPWHDIHCKLEGPIVMDVLANFYERWELQADEHLGDLLIVTEKEYAVNAPATVKEDKMWNVQLFRSISSDSAAFDLRRINTIPKRKGKYVDDSIHRAYIHQIRQADHFLFIENQYFLGSAYFWDDENDTKAHHIIPAEITHKIIEKMNNGEHFCAYIIVPIHPEGDPASNAVQEILHWQRRTMAMMYKMIADAIAENALETHPTDYLSFYCLGKRESAEDIPKDLPVPETCSPAYTYREQRRFMIYVHSKMMIVDDDYIIIGTANVNQRSMAGTRDSEIAVGGFQPSHTIETSDGSPRGDIFNFRSALWAEHLGADFQKDLHGLPGELKCMKAVNATALKNWEAFVSVKPAHMGSHLLKYPIDVSQDGSVSALKDSPYFPDSEAPVLGANNCLPSKLTT